MDDLARLHLSLDEYTRVYILAYHSAAQQYNLVDVMYESITGMNLKRVDLRLDSCVTMRSVLLEDANPKIHTGSVGHHARSAPVGQVNDYDKLRCCCLPLYIEKWFP